MTRSVLVPVWRLREIRNIADTIAYRAALCPGARLAIVAEREFLKQTAHIRLFIDPKLKLGEAYHYIQILRNATYGDAPHSKVDLIEVTICFNGELTTRHKWRETSRAIVRELGKVIFFSKAAKRQVVVKNERKFIEDFVNYMTKKLPFAFDTTNRPRLMVAYLREIVNRYLHRKTREVVPHIQRLLAPYLGPDGW
jgi:hypothetical protein